MPLPVPLLLLVFISCPSFIPYFDIFLRLLTFQESSDPDYIINPCYPEGFNITMKASSIYDTECTKKPKGYNPDQELFMVGAADSDKCGSLVQSMFDFKTCSSPQCSFDGVEQPPVTGDFMVTHGANKITIRNKVIRVTYQEDRKKKTLMCISYCFCQAYAGFFYTSRALINRLINSTADLDQFKASVRKFCHTHWTTVSSSNWFAASSNIVLKGGARRDERGFMKKKCRKMQKKVWDGLKCRKETEVQTSTNKERRKHKQ